MCSILGIFDIASPEECARLRKLAVELSQRQRHRGPDWSGVANSDTAVLAHERLSIVDVDSGSQPLQNDDRTIALAVNGEIYNHRQLESQLNPPYDFQTRSDCEVILPLYQRRGVEF